MRIKEAKKLFKREKTALKSDYKKEKKEARREYKKSLCTLKSDKEENLTRAYFEEGKPLPKNPPKRSILEEIGNAITHGVGSILSVVAFILMLCESDTPIKAVSTIIYFFGSFIMFTMSCLYHSFKHGGITKRLFRRFDYSSIYLLIGATFAPILLTFIGGTFGIVFFVIQWSVIVTGISLVCVFGPSRLRFIHIPLYILLGWSAVMLLPNMFRSSLQLAFWTLGGGVAYTLGIIPFVLKNKVSHFIWHFFVLFGAILQWIGIYTCIY